MIGRAESTIATAGELVGRARRQTGLEHLGSDPWQVGLEQLLAAVAADVREPEAVERIEGLLVQRLVQRLRIEDWYARNGREAAAGVQGPLVILGLPRSATTALHHLLSVDQQLRYLRSWELNDPVPPPDRATEHDDPRRPTEVEQSVRHIVTVDGPAEDWPIHALAFDHAELVLPVPSYSRWWRERDHSALFGYHERILRLLHSHRPPHRWLLKLPSYLFLLEELAEHYPDARFVMTHRDPIVAIASTCSTVADSRRQRVPTWQPDRSFGPLQLEHWAEGMRKAIDARAALGEERFVDVTQHELEADPVRTVARVYETAGLSLDGAVADSMGEWAAANRRGQRGEHVYSLEEYGLTEQQVADAFAPYLERFGDLCRPT